MINMSLKQMVCLLTIYFATCMSYEVPFKRRGRNVTTNIKRNVKRSEHLKLKLLTKYRNLNMNGGKFGRMKMSFLVEIEAKDVPEEISERDREAVDIVLVIDVSGSMSGEKIDLVRKSLKFIISELRSDDRVAILKFNQYVEKVSEFMYASKKNSKFLIEQVESEIFANGNTNIGSAVDEGADEILDRNDWSNDVGFLFLSDGQDTSGNHKSEVRSKMKYLQNQMNRRNGNLFVCSFGYGHNHDEEMLSSIRKPNDGKFYYIEDNSSLEYSVLNCFGELLSVSANDLRLVLNSEPGVTFDVNEEIYNLDRISDSKVEKKMSHISYGKKEKVFGRLNIDFDELDCSEGESVRLLKASLYYTVANISKNLKNSLWIRCVSNDEERGAEVVEVASEEVTERAIEGIQNSRKAYLAGNQKKANLILQDSLDYAQKSSSLGGNQKRDFRNILSIGNVANNKKFLRSFDTFRNKTSNSEAQSFSTTNNKTKSLLDRSSA